MALISTGYLQMNNSITVLNLSMNGFGASGAVSLAAALLSNTCLQELDISNNRIDAEGFKAIGKLLAQNTSITLLEVLDILFTSFLYTYQI